MPSQENIQFCESADNLNHIFSYENDLRSQYHNSLRLKNDSVEQPPSLQSHKGFPRTDDYSKDVSGGGNDSGDSNSGKRISTHELNSETVCAHIYIFIFVFIYGIQCAYTHFIV